MVRHALKLSLTKRASWRCPSLRTRAFNEDKDKYVCLRVDISISILVTSDGGGITGYDRRRSELSNAPLNMKQDTTSTQK